MFSALISGVALLVTGQQFLRTAPGDGGTVCLFWANRNFTYDQCQAGYSQMPNGAAFVPIDAAYDSWTTVAASCSDFNFIKGPLVPNRAGFQPDAGVNINLILFREQSCFDLVQPTDPCWSDSSCNDAYDCWQDLDSALAITTTTFDSATGELYNSTTEINASPHRTDLASSDPSPWVFGVVDAGCLPGQSVGDVNDLQGTMTHEIGHSIGLAHVPDPSSTMSPDAPPGNTCKREIDPGTAAGFCTIYPKGQPTPPCGPLSQNQQEVIGTNSFGCSAVDGPPGLLLLLALAGRLRRRNRSPGLR